MASAERAVDAVTGGAPGHELLAVLAAYAHAETLGAVGGGADLAQLAGARRRKADEILSGAVGDAGSGGARGAGADHLAALYGTAPELSRFGRDVRDGVFDGACAQGARVVLVALLRAGLAPAAGAEEV